MGKCRKFIYPLVAMAVLFWTMAIAGTTESGGEPSVKSSVKSSGSIPEKCSSNPKPIIDQNYENGSELSDIDPDNPGKETSNDAGDESKLSLVWEADDCGCTPIQPKRQQGVTKITYGFYHQNMETQENEAKTQAIAKIKFSRLNRLGYSALLYDVDAGFTNYEDWENNGFIKGAHTYNSRVDLVVAFPDNPVALFSNKSKTRTLAGEIERLIKEHGGDGVTIDLRQTQDLDGEILLGFLGVLREKLVLLNKKFYLNLFMDFDKTQKSHEFNSFSLDQIAEMTESLDLFLIMVVPPVSKVTEGKPDLENNFLALSELLDRYGLENNNIEFKDKILPVLPFGHKKNEEIFNQILTVGYGGVGFWPEKSLANAETQFIGTVFKNHPLPKQMDAIKRLLLHFCPDCCKLICPNRVFLIVPTEILGAALILYYIFSLFFCELRSFASTHAMYFVGACVVFVGLVTGIILCVPFWQGMRTLSVVLLILGGIGYLIVEFIRKRRQARFP